MPELPEVETTISEIKPEILGKKIVDVFCTEKKIVKKPKFEKFVEQIKGKKIQKIWRKGKYIVFELSGGKVMLLHLKLTGHLLVGKWKKVKKNFLPLTPGPISTDPINKFVRLVFVLNNKKMLALSDLRKFAKIEFGDKEEIFSSKEFQKIGPDPFSVNFEQFKQILLKKKKKRIKETLMDQELVSGIGNIYSDEILWEAKIHPLKKVSELKDEDFKNIFLATRKILKKAISLKGESISDFRRPSGEKGYFDTERKVYKREGENCLRCSEKIKRIKIKGRSAYFCPSCQK